MVSISIKRVVSVFILRPNKSPPPSIRPQRQPTNAYHIALFRRCDTMPTFPCHWAGISGSIEEHDANPFEAAVRELKEETNIGDFFDLMNLRNSMKQGLHVDVSSNRSKGAFGGRVIRVYPFALTLPTKVVDNLSPKEEVGDQRTVSGKFTTTVDPCANIEMKGTEHDQMKFMTIAEFLDLSEPCVPALKIAFHHATSGSYLELPTEIRSWEQDRVNGAAFLARQAVTLAAAHTETAASMHDSNRNNGKLSAALSIAMLRPSMVPIVNVMKEFDRRVVQLGEERFKVRDELLQSLGDEGERCVELGVEMVLRYCKECQRSHTSSTSEFFVVGTFSRSSTMKSILGRVLQSLKQQTTKVKVVCSQSTPGDEGMLMAFDIHDATATCLSDESFRQRIQEGEINLVLVGADCILPEGKGVVNKVGTAALARCCKGSNVPVVCFADRWKIWEDEHPPGLEELFELVPWELLHRVIVPS